MSAISLKSITGITSITTPAGVDNQLTLHTNNTTERVKIDVAGNVHINNHLAVAGVVTATTFVGNLTGETSQVTIGNGANNRIITASGTNTLDCAGNFTFNGNVMELGATGAEGGALYIHGGSINNPGGRDAKVWIEDPTNNDWALHINKPSNNYGIQVAMDNSASHAFFIKGGGGERFRITGSGDIAKSGNIYPRSADTFDIGDNGTSRWKSIYAQNFYASNLVDIGGGTHSRNLTVHAATNSVILIEGASNGTSNLMFGDESDEDVGMLGYNHASNYLAFTVNTEERLRITSTGEVNIGGDYAQTTYKMKVSGSFAATTKSFVIDHPTKENHQLRYACLEGPENSVYIRGRSSDPVIELPDYWTGLVHEDSITVNVTPIGNHKVWVESINNNSITIGSDGSEYFYTVFAERKDVDKLEVEVAK